MCDAVCSHQEMEQGRFDPWDELRRYLKSPLVGGIVDIVGHWGVCQLQWLEIRHTDPSQQHQAVEYPTLSQMAQDYLAIQGSATPSEPSQEVGSQGPPIATIFQLPLSKHCNF